MELDRMLKALGEPMRLKIFQALLERKHCVRSLSKKFGISESAISQHMKVMKDAGLVYGEKYGYHTHYLLDKEKIAQIADSILDLTREKPDNCHKRGPNCEAAETVGCKAGKKQ